MKRKFDTLAHKAAEEAAAPQIRREQVESLELKHPDFWLPSFMPTAGALRSFSKLESVESVCRGGNRPCSHVRYT
jgi:hypothetical protein